MRGKYFVIIALVSFLVFTVFKMMEFENSIRKTRVIEVKIEDKNKALIEVIDDESLKKIAESANYYFMTNGNYFSALKTTFENHKKTMVWEDVFIKGVNLGVAIPGHFPAEFSASFDDYLKWLEQIGKMNANVVRTYTIFPPEFYNAFAYYNLTHQNHELYIMHGVWAKIPESDNYYEPDYHRSFKKEIIDVIDVIHGKAVIEPKPGHASGVYATDISDYVIGILLGREWEPKAVTLTIKRNRNNHYSGKFINLNHGNPMEAWLAGVMDFTVLYETQTYQSQCPISFVNWLPLDPMFHTTEHIENKKIREYDNDFESVDFTKFHSTNLFEPGIYAAYHVYPYYPDYIYLKKEYAETVNKDGQRDNFLGYLKDLKKHNQGMPLVIAEYGIPSSRGNSHYNPYGFNQGGHSEKVQADLSLTMTKDIYDSECAGAIYFEWIDEWFKHNWLVMDFEQPYDDRKIWHNMENPEQNFGILAMESRSKTMDGSMDDWKNSKFTNKNTIQVAADADPGYFYLSSYLPNFDFNKNNLYVAIDVFDDEKGDHKLPFSDKVFENGFEYLMAIKSTDNAKILVDDSFSVFTDIYNDYVPVYASKYNTNGIFIDQQMLTNRGREDMLGLKTDSIIHTRSNLVEGNTSLPELSNADFYWKDSSKIIESRLAWHLLNVSDPAKHFVLDDKPNTDDIEYSETEGFNIYFFITDKNDKILQQFPKRKPFNYLWKGWSQPEYSERLKPVYGVLKDYFYELKPPYQEIVLAKPEDGVFEIAEFYENRSGAVSVNFSNSGFSQYQFAFPIIEKYGINASFGVINNILKETPGLYEVESSIKIKRLGRGEVIDLLEKGHEISLQIPSINTVFNDTFLNTEKVKLQSKINAKVNLMLLSGNETIDMINQEKTSFQFIKTSSNIKQSQNDSYHLNGVPMRLSSPTQLELDSILNTYNQSWLILDYQHVYPENSSEYTQIKRQKNNQINLVSPSTFEKQIRLARNSGYWIAPVSVVGKYMKEKENATISVNRYGKLLFVTVKSDLNTEIYNQPLSIVYYTDSKNLKISDAENAGYFENRTGKIIINLLINKEITIEILD